MKKVHYAWAVCAAGTLTMVCTMGFCATLLSAYLPYISAAGISGSAGSLMLSLRSFSTMVTIFFIAQIYDRISLRTGILLAMLACAGSMLVFSVGGSAAIYFAAASLAGVGYAMGGPIPISLLIGSWFKGRRGTALGICSAGSGIATVFFPKVVDVLVTRFSLRAMFLVAAGFILLSALLVWLLVRSNPGELGLSAYEGGTETAKKASVGNSALPPVGWALLILVMVFQGGYNPGSSHLSVLMTASGYSTAAAASFLSLFGLFVMAGKFLFGVAADRFGAKQTTTFAYMLVVIGCLLPLVMDGQLLWPCAATMALFGLSVGPNSVGIALVAADLSSSATYAKTMKWMEISALFGSIVMGVIPGMYYDAFGNYQGAYVMMAAFAAFAVPLLWVLYRTRMTVDKVV